MNSIVRILFSALVASCCRSVAAGIAMLTTAIVVVAPLQTLASDIFVDNQGGDNRNRGYQEKANEGTNGPVQTIARALQIASPADRIILRNTGVPYRESVTLSGRNNSGAFGQPFRIVGNGAILSGAKPVPSANWRHVKGNTFSFLPERLSHQRLFANGRPLQYVAAAPTQQPALKPLQWSIFQQKILFEVEARKLPQSYAIEFASEKVGLTLYDVHNVEIKDLIVEAFQLDGINAHDLVRECNLTGVTSRGNGRSGISVGGASRVRIVNSLVGDNGAAQIRTEGYCHLSLKGNELLENPAPKILREGGKIVEE